MSTPELPPILSGLYDITDFSRFPRDPQDIQAKLDEEYNQTVNRPAVKYGMELRPPQAEAWQALAPYADHLLSSVRYASSDDTRPNKVHTAICVSPRPYEVTGTMGGVEVDEERQVYFSRLEPSSQGFWKYRLHIGNINNRGEDYPWEVMRTMVLPPPPGFEAGDENRNERGLFQEAINAACMTVSGLYLFRSRIYAEDGKKTLWDPAAAWFGIDLFKDGEAWRTKRYDLGISDSHV